MLDKQKVESQSLQQALVRLRRIASNKPGVARLQELRAALKRAFKRRDGPTLIEVPVSQMPSPWEFIHMPRVRG